MQEAEGILARDGDVDDGQGDQAVNEQAHHHRDGIHHELAAHRTHVGDEQNLSADQEEDSHRGEPAGGEPGNILKQLEQLASCAQSQCQCEGPPPDGNADQVHGGLVDALEEVPQRFPILPHSGQGEAKGHAQGDQTQDVDAADVAWTGQLLVCGVDGLNVTKRVFKQRQA